MYTPDLSHEKNSGCSLAPLSVSPDRLPSYRESPGPSHLLLHPNSLAQFIYVWIEGLLRMSDPTYALPGTPLAKYGRMFLERVERIKIAVDGSEQFEVFVSDYVGKLRELEEWARDGTDW